MLCGERLNMRLWDVEPGYTYWFNEAGGSHDDPNSNYQAEVLTVSKDGQHGPGAYAKVRILGEKPEELTLFEAHSYRFFKIYAT